MTACRHRSALVLLLVFGLAAAACSDDDDTGASDAVEGVTTTQDAAEGDAGTTTAPPASEPVETTTTSGPAEAESVTSAVDISGVTVDPLTDAGGGVPQVSAAASLASSYAEAEYLVSGTASTYTGPATGPAEVATTAQAYTTRIVVRAPTDPEAFSGRVVVEPFNTSGGADADVTWQYLEPLLVDQGDVWVGVSERWISAEALRTFDAERYAAISIPSNGFAWDILSQIGGLLDEGGEASPLGDLPVDHVYMVGYSQNGIDTATYASTFGELARMSDGSAIYDGYLPLAHSGSMTPLDSGPSALPAFENIPFGTSDVPVIDMESESDVIGFVHPSYSNPGHASVRRGDSDEPGDLYRLYEITGGSHVQSVDGCDHDGTTFPLEHFVRATYALLTGWVEDGVVPPMVDRIEMSSIGTVSVPVRDEFGNALGGVRSPFVDVPLATFQGGDTGGVVCGLAGVEIPLDPAVLDAQYTDAADFLARFEANLADTVDAGFLLADEEDEILAYAEERAQQAFAG